MDEVTKAKFQEVLKDEAFVKELVALETPEDVQAKLKERGVEISVENLVAIRDALGKAIENGGELSEDDLENVAGGEAITLALIFFGALAGTMAGGIGLGAALGAIGEAFRRW